MQWSRIGRACLLLGSAVGLFSGSSGCAGPPASPDGTITTARAPIVVPYRPPMVGVACVDDSGKTDVQFVPQANRLLADLADAAVRPNSGPFTLYYILMSGHPYDPAQTRLVIQIPGLPAQPGPPALTPYPPSSGDPFTDATTHARIQRANDLVLRSYQQVLARDDAHLAAVREATSRQTERLRHLSVRLDPSGTDIFGCVTLAAARLAAAPAGSERWLWLTGDLLNDKAQDYLPPQSLNLHNVRIRALDMWCISAPECQATKAFWTRYFAAAGTQDVQFFDPAQSLTLDTTPQGLTATG